MYCIFKYSSDLPQASLEALHALYSRSNFSDDQFSALVLPMYDKQCVERFAQLFAWSAVDAEDIDDDKYLFAKKFSEVSVTTTAALGGCANLCR